MQQALDYFIGIITCLGMNPLIKKIEIAAEIINDILQDRTGIIVSSVLGPIPGNSEDLEDVARYSQENETIEL